MTSKLLKVNPRKSSKTKNYLRDRKLNQPQNLEEQNYGKTEKKVINRERIITTKKTESRKRLNLYSPAPATRRGSGTRTWISWARPPASRRGTRSSSRIPRSASPPAPSAPPRRPSAGSGVPVRPCCRPATQRCPSRPHAPPPCPNRARGKEGELARSQRETKRGGREGNTKEEKRRESKKVGEAAKESIAPFKREAHG